jgi:hypothetical protein
MDDAHERFEQLAVGHVLGGLEPVAAAEFRSHLLGCRDCRLRVAELRDIAADLVAAERDERARARVTTELPRRVREGDDEEPRPSRIGVRHVTIAAVVVLLLAGGIAFWSFHLRTSAATYAAIAQHRGEVLTELATGVPIAADLADGIDGLVVLDGEQVAFSLNGLAPLVTGESLIGWLVDAAEVATPVLIVRPTQLDGGASLAAVVDADDADELVVTRERGQPGEVPGHDVVLRVPLKGEAD